MRRGLIHRITAKLLVGPVLWVLLRLKSLLLRIYQFRAVRWTLNTKPARLLARLAVGCYSLAAYRILPWYRRTKQRVRRFLASREVLGWILMILICGMMGGFLAASNYRGIYWAYFILLLSAVGMFGFAVITLKNPLYGLLFWVFSSPLLSVFVAFKFMPGMPAISGDRACLFILLLALLLWERRSGKPQSTPAIGLLIFVFILTLMPSMVRAERLNSGLQMVGDNYLAPMSLYFFARRWIQDQATLRKAIWVVFLVGIYFALVGIPEYFTHKNIFAAWSGRATMQDESLGLVRVQGPARSPGEYGLVVSMGSYIAILLASWERNHTRRVLYILLAAVMIVAVYMTLRRGVYVGWLMGLLVLAFFSVRSRRFIVPGLVLVLAVVGLNSAVIKSSDIYTERITYAAPYYQRLVLNATSMEMVRQHPLLGVGMGQYPNVMTKYLRPYKDLSPLYSTGLPSPHNSYFRILTEAGFLAFIPWVLLLASAAWYTYLAFRRTAPGQIEGRDAVALFWAFGSSHLMQATSTDAFLYAPYLNAIFFFLLGAATAVHYKSKKESEAEKPAVTPVRTRRIRQAVRGVST